MDSGRHQYPLGWQSPLFEGFGDKISIKTFDL